ncbi:MAG: FAD:protein FMN transferase [Clostridia bacterium]|nr:FAD:protein FMN transferase [Clostridia bacterium]
MKRNRLFRAAALLCAALTLCGALTGCAATYEERTAFAMGSVLTARLYAPKEDADLLFDRITEKVNAADACLSATDPSSEISAVNAKGSANASVFTRKTLGDMVMLCNMLNGTLDVTVGAVTQLWGFSTDHPRLPSEEELRAAQETVGLERLLIDDVNGTIVLGPGQKIDPGAFGKGVALDEARDALQSKAYSAVVSFGGSVLLFGTPKKGKSWTVGVRDPFGGPNDYFASLSLTPDRPDYTGFVATSGSYEKQFTEDGVVYHHILSPLTGYPVETDLVSVTVYATSGINSDALSTACFINGLNGETLRWLNSFGAEAVFVYQNKEYYVTDGLKDAFTLTNDSFTLKTYEE